LVHALTVAPARRCGIGRNGHDPSGSVGGVVLPPAPRAIFLGDADVRYAERAPAADLAPWVQSFWHLRCLRPTTLRVLPDGCMDIINGDLVGSLSTVLMADLQPGDEALGVRLRPGAFTALYGVPADELTDVRLPLADVVRPRPLRDAARDADHPDPLATVAMFQPDVTALAHETGYSVRHLRRRLVRATGHSPRKLARIGRMQAVLAAGRGESWARTAVEFGYYDEAHMINDIRALADATPHTMLTGLDPVRTAAPATQPDR
jgi:AraC-like DNA-binding protein